MSSLRVVGYGLALLGWSVVGFGICALWGSLAIVGVRSAFDQDARILHRLLSQKTEQHEAVLSSLVALHNSGVDAAVLSTFADAMRQRYPQLEAIQRCALPRPCREPWLSGAGSPDANLQQRVLEAALATRPDQPIAVVADPEQPRFVLSQAAGSVVFALWVEGTSFARTTEFAQPDSSFDLSLTPGGVVLFQRPPQREAGLESGLLPLLRVEKALGSASQPFWLQVQRQVRLSELPLGPMLIFLLAGTGLTLLSVRFLFAVRQVRSERLEAQQALQRERIQAEGTVQAVSDALFRFDAQGSITLVNPAANALLGVEDSLVGQPLMDALRFQATLGKQPLIEFWDDFWHTPRAAELPEGTMLPDGGGRARLVEGTLSPLHDPQGLFAGGVLSVRDLGPFRQRLLEALDASERRLREHQALLAHAGRIGTLSEIAAGIAHELNQPLTAILSQNQASLRLLDEDEPDVDGVQRSLRASAEQARRAGHILERLRAHVARQPLRRELVDLRQVVDNVRVLTEHELLERGVELESDLGTHPLEVEGDAIQLEQVLHNLLRNALEASSEVAGEQRRIQLRAGRAEAALWLEVRDFGHGIAPEVLPQLFTPFVSGTPGGLGLGLSLSQTLVQGMGGQLRGENVPSGGARFVLTLPARRRERVQG